MSMRLPISESFVSIQGEGKLTGTPSYFVRLSGCNLRCRWCDTPYASWNPDGGPEDVGEIASRALASGARHVVITGGEPMIFKHLGALCEQIHAQGQHITIETAGTVFEPVACDLMSVSPKLRNSTPWNDARDPDGSWAARHEERRINKAALQALLDRAPEKQLKFVVTSPQDVEEIDMLLAALRGVSHGDVLLMPEGVRSPTPGEVAWIVATCVARGWRYCPRLHLQLFGNTRGT